MAPRFATRTVRRIVVKVGSAVLARDGMLDGACVERLTADLADCLNADPTRRIVVVSSGAVASGFRALGLDKPPKLISDKQAAAAVGQPRLMAEYAAAFARARPPRAVAQVLLTAEDIDHRARFLNARHTLERLLETPDAAIVPIINENDSVSFSEIKLGDNDRLGSLVASLIDADLLVILSSVEGVHRAADPGSTGSVPRMPRRTNQKIEIVPVLSSLKEALAHVNPDQSSVGTGGMVTKVTAACSAATLGTAVVIAGGDQPHVVRRILDGEPIGTYFPPSARAPAARARWIGFAARPRGILGIDEGARRALLTRGASLLPSGIASVQGDFGVGALVEIHGPDGEPIARGLASYASDDLNKLRGRRAAEIERVLGFRYRDEAVHRDDLALLTHDRLEPDDLNE